MSVTLPAHIGMRKMKRTKAGTVLIFDIGINLTVISITFYFITG